MRKWVCRSGRRIRGERTRNGTNRRMRKSLLALVTIAETAGCWSTPSPNHVEPQGPNVAPVHHAAIRELDAWTVARFVRADVVADFSKATGKTSMFGGALGGLGSGVSQASSWAKKVLGRKDV